VFAGHVSYLPTQMNIDAKDGKLGPQDFQALIGPLS